MFSVEGSNLVQNYAVVSEAGVVERIIWLARQNEPEFPSAVALGELQVTPGDKYEKESGKFYREGVEVKTKVFSLQEEVSDLTLMLGEVTQELYNSDMEAINNV